MQEYQLSLPKDFAGEVRIFPLPNVVVFPSSVNPLRVFESRYREMFEDAINGDQLLAMATLLPGYESDYYSRPPLAPTICVGHITQHRRNDDGTYDFLLVGLKRAQIDHEITPVRSYRRAAVRVLEDVTSPDPEQAAELGGRLADWLKDTGAELESLLKLFRSGELSVATLTDIVAQHADLALDTKLKLLQEVDPLARADLLLDHLSPSAPQRRQSPPFSEN